MCKKMKITNKDRYEFIKNIINDDVDWTGTIAEITNTEPDEYKKLQTKYLETCNKSNRFNAIGIIFDIICFITFLMLIIGVCSISPKDSAQTVKEDTIVLGIIASIFIISLIMAVIMGKISNAYDNKNAWYRSNKEKMQSINQENLFFDKDSILKQIISESLLTHLRLEIQFCKMVDCSNGVDKIVEQEKNFLSLINVLKRATGGKNNSISMAELDDYDQIANKIQVSAKHIADQIEQQIVIPVTDKMIEYTMQNSDQNLIDFLPHNLHKEYSNRLLKNAIEE